MSMFYSNTADDYPDACNLYFLPRANTPYLASARRQLRSVASLGLFI